MGALSNWPDYQAYIEQSWGYPMFEGGSWGALGGASNVIVGTNPPYSITDFYAFFPKYAGPNLSLTGTLTGGSTLVTGINTQGLAIGQYVAVLPSPAIPPGTTISQINVQGTGANGQITLSQPAAASGTFPIIVYVGPPIVPVQVIVAYLNLASASLVQARWMDTWAFAVSLFTAHFLSLYLRSEGNCSTQCGQAAAAGLKQGITVSVSGGGVSQSTQPTPGLDDWSAWNLTSYGVQLATFAKAIGSGILWCW